jgi:hypothetical protein
MKKYLLFVGSGLCLGFFVVAQVSGQGVSGGSRQASTPQQWTLKSDWKMQSGMTDTSAGGRISMTGFDAMDWYTVSVPTTIVGGLVANKVYPFDPFQIKHALGISGIQTNSSSWVNTGKGSKRQIDLVIDRKDDVINLCEMKFSIKSFTIDKNYHAELQDKIETFRTATQTTKSLFLTMITTFGIARNEYSNNLVQNSLKMDDLFG